MAKLSRDEIDAQESEQLPDRKAMSVVSPESADFNTDASFTDDDGESTDASADASADDEIESADASAD
ncbi:MAG: hypothetical protein M3P34_08310, partial [Actinomycetota bacterium]|nr:hypothetical protein [Actinomycetota bacterium]